MTDGSPQPKGEMQIEEYCKQRNLVASHNDYVWWCEDANGTIKHYIIPIDIDIICQVTYRNGQAFAIEIRPEDIDDKQRRNPAYRWRCYGPKN